MICNLYIKTQNSEAGITFPPAKHYIILFGQHFDAEYYDTSQIKKRLHVYNMTCSNFEYMCLHFGNLIEDRASCIKMAASVVYLQDI